MTWRLAVLRWLARVLRLDALHVLTHEVAALPVDDRVRALRVLARDAEVPTGLLADDPWLRLLDLPDQKDAAYLWVLGAGAKGGDIAAFQASLNSIYIRHHQREPRALHLVVAHPVDVQALTADEVRAFVKPWLADIPKET